MRCPLPSPAHVLVSVLAEAQATVPTWAPALVLKSVLTSTLVEALALALA